MNQVTIVQSISYLEGKHQLIDSIHENTSSLKTIF